MRVLLSCMINKCLKKGNQTQAAAAALSRGEKRRPDSHSRSRKTDKELYINLPPNLSLLSIIQPGTEQLRVKFPAGTHQQAIDCPLYTDEQPRWHTSPVTYCNPATDSSWDEPGRCSHPAAPKQLKPQQTWLPSASPPRWRSVTAQACQTQVGLDGDNRGIKTTPKLAAGACAWMVRMLSCFSRDCLQLERGESGFPVQPLTTAAMGKPAFAPFLAATAQDPTSNALVAMLLQQNQHPQPKFHLPDQHSTLSLMSPSLLPCPEARAVAVCPPGTVHACRVGEKKGSYCVQMKGKDPLHIKDCIELGQWLSTVPERKGSWSSIVQKGRRFYHRTVVLDQSDYEVPCQSLGWMLEELFQPSESSAFAPDKHRATFACNEMSARVFNEGTLGQLMNVERLPACWRRLPKAKTCSRGTGETSLTSAFEREFQSLRFGCQTAFPVTALNEKQTLPGIYFAGMLQMETEIRAEEGDSSGARSGRSACSEAAACSVQSSLHLRFFNFSFSPSASPSRSELTNPCIGIPGRAASRSNRPRCRAPRPEKNNKEDFTAVVLVGGGEEKTA
ncbi:hypothetical protein Anapl_16512 [Anas platyrhynchos]|uniref:Uncharacterized protein n=1 Tax=Anas platyrhynchos TaxID=8839 RepID=R0M4W4_ANAPL|nr:hypothetical protein Anapl_16512 [Anas platyrhynchos]